MLYQPTLRPFLVNGVGLLRVTGSSPAGHRDGQRVDEQITVVGASVAQALRDLLPGVAAAPLRDCLLGQTGSSLNGFSSARRRSPSGDSM